MQRPLSGLSIVETASDDCPPAVRLALAFAGRLAADLGAAVTVIETENDATFADLPPMIGGTSAVRGFLMAGKTICRVPAAARRATAERAAANSRALLTDADDPSARNAASRGIRGLVSLAGGGHPAGQSNSEFTLMALGGLLDLLGDPAREPLKIAGSQLAYTAGMALFTGLVAAMLGKERETVRVNLLETAVWLNWKSVAAPSWGVPVPVRQGKAAEWQVIRCADGYLALVYRDPDWATLKALVADPVLEEPRFQKRIERKQHAGEVAAIVEKALMRYTRAQVRDIALARRLPIGPVWNLAELAQEPHSVARGMLQPVPGFDRPAPRLPVLWNGGALAPDAALPEPAQAAVAGGA